MLPREPGIFYNEIEAALGIMPHTAGKIVASISKKAEASRSKVRGALNVSSTSHAIAKRALQDMGPTLTCRGARLRIGAKKGPSPSYTHEAQPKYLSSNVLCSSPSHR